MVYYLHKNKFNSLTISLVHQHGREFLCFGPSMIAMTSFQIDLQDSFVLSRMAWNRHRIEAPGGVPQHLFHAGSSPTERIRKWPIQVWLNCGRRKNYLEDERSKRNTILRLPGFQRGKKVVHMVAVLTLTRLYDSDFKERLTINLNTSATKLPLFVYRTTYCRPNNINMVFILLDSLSAFDTVDHSFCCGGFRLISVSGVRFQLGSNLTWKSHPICLDRQRYFSDHDISQGSILGACASELIVPLRDIIAKHNIGVMFNNILTLQKIVKVVVNHRSTFYETMPRFYRMKLPKIYSLLWLQTKNSDQLDEPIIIRSNKIAQSAGKMPRAMCD